MKTAIQKNNKTELLSFSNGHTMSKTAGKCSFEKDNLEKDFAVFVLS